MVAQNHKGAGHHACRGAFVLSRARYAIHAHPPIPARELAHKSRWPCVRRQRALPCRAMTREDVHTCHAECPCQSGGEPRPDFIAAERCLPIPGFGRFVAAAVADTGGSMTEEEFGATSEALCAQVAGP